MDVSISEHSGGARILQRINDGAGMLPHDVYALTLARSLHFDLKNLPTGVVAAVWTYVMLPFVFAALWAFHQMDRRQLVVLSSEALLRPGNSLFW